jgi:hypothetical protein
LSSRHCELEIHFNLLPLRSASLQILFYQVVLA